MRKTPRERFLAMVSLDIDTGCWIWTGHKDRPRPGFNRYPKFNPGRSYPGTWACGKMYAHRFAYTEFVGPIPDGYQINHLCEVPLCVNPNHLEAVTAKEHAAFTFRHRQVA